MNHHAEVARELDAALVQNAGAARSHLEHFLVADLIDLAGTRDDTRIGRVDTGNVRVDLADVRLDARRDGDSGRIRTPAAQRSDVSRCVDSLESRDDDDAAFGKRHADAIGVDFANRRLAVHAIGNQADLPPGEADGLLAKLGDSHGQKRHGDHLAGGKQRVHLAGVRAI